MTIQIGIIADDLTGASDSGVQFTRMGMTAQVIFHLGEEGAASARTDVVVVDTDSRSLPAEQAYAQAASAANYLKESGALHFYKKMDSTLRGNIGAEIDGVMDAIPFDMALVAPAFPKIGRTTVAGRHYLHGTLVDQTEMGRDPKSPVRESDLARLLASQSKRKTGLLPLSVLREGDESVGNRLDELRRGGAELIICDAETDEDMQRIARSVSVYPARMLWTGSAGLADFLPQALGLGGSGEKAAPLPKTGYPIVLVAGSISPTTREQLQHVHEQGGVARVELNPLPLLGAKAEQEQEIARCIAEMEAALQAGQGNIALSSQAGPEDVRAAKELEAEKGLPNGEISNRIASALGEVAAAIVKKYDLQGMILTGGDTAKAVCRHMGATGMELLRELEPGIPLGRLVGPHRFCVVTKAGAFGTRPSLWRAFHELRGESSE
ncbi:four-carbon acid sugar kinase family protein [Brevibacillus composti]|uniref:Four-carbon acid sugar kinase family protein n=1 Tax=Brevibacillus composti TaxID=2796470 RepID=A0A7T5JN22_9BACL|nr:four-carbon acid sugar kinase family protein [Brevibacillus composti]QQE73622.1 four-carbon acid sugar kinase family protein [Brevibacillus composti]QUO40703.1 four-carbon acid sugar kinase family protein [Brevibacillus composti]